VSYFSAEREELSERLPHEIGADCAKHSANKAGEQCVKRCHHGYSPAISFGAAWCKYAS
jgi:hypothetical protein